MSPCITLKLALLRYEKHLESRIVFKIVIMGSLFNVMWVFYLFYCKSVKQFEKNVLPTITLF